MIDKVPSINERAPNFQGTAVVNGQLKKISMKDYEGKYLVLFFFPLTFSFVCPTEVISFNESFEHFKKMETEVVGCSTDTEELHLSWVNTPREKGGLGPVNVTLLSDQSKVISRAYGILDEDVGRPVRALFIIDRKGLLRHITINDMVIGRSIEEILRLIEAFQYTDVKGDLCPANWVPGLGGLTPAYVKKRPSTSK